MRSLSLSEINDRIASTTAKDVENVMYVFDFDDTLALTDSAVYLIRNGVRSKLTAAQYAAHVPSDDDQFDYSDFSTLVNARSTELIKFVKHINELNGHVYILSARTTDGPIHEFVAIHQLSVKRTTALANGDPTRKKETIEQWIKEHSPSRIEFFDDSIRNVELVHSLNSMVDVEIVCWHVKE